MKTWIVVGLLVLSAAAFYTEPDLIKQTRDDIYWTLWKYAPMPEGATRPRRPESR